MPESGVAMRENQFIMMSEYSFDKPASEGDHDARCAGVVFLGERGQTPRVCDALVRAVPRCGSVEPALDHEASTFFEWLCGARGVSAERYRASVVRRRQAACLRAAGCTTFADARQRLNRDPARLDRTLTAVLIGVTSFFRDGAPFRALASEITKPALKQKREVRVLSVGCSEGQELYSAGIVLGEAGLLERATLWGVDCRHDAIAHARRGVYSNEALGEVPECARARWFRREGSAWSVIPELRDRARWQIGDALSLDLIDRFDVILCRNLAIYLRPEAACSLWIVLEGMLDRGGVMMVGKAERPAGTLMKIAPCLYAQREA